MVDFLNGLERTHKCGQLRAADIDKQVTVMGFVAKYRNLGNLLFIDLRDIGGVVQVAFDDQVDKAIFDKATTIRNEYVIAVTGKVRSRGSNINKNMPTGEVEILAHDLKILSEADVTPFVITEDIKVGEPLRLKYRYLDLRRSALQSKLVMRDKITRVVRNYLSDNGFLEIETPFLGKSTPEGARDYLVPSRLHNGEFYALPQSPQLFKQLLMIAGMDRYYQIAKCFRDEDLRANRQPEFSQIDMEMSYVEDNEQVMNVAEGLIKAVFKECLGMELNEKFRRIPYSEAMEKWGSDKPDTRFDMQLKDLSDIVKDCGFSVFTNAVAGGGSVRAINAKGLCSKMTRKEVDACGEFVKSYGAKGLAYAMFREDGSITSSILKFLSEEEQKAIFETMDAQKGDILFFVADKNKVVFDSLGALRCHIADKYELYDKSKFDFLWVVDFPLLEYSEEDGRYYAVHHPFTSAIVEDIPLLDTDPLKVRSNAYDMVINGQEAGGGSIRIHDPLMQEKIFSILGFTQEDIEERFGFFVEAFKYGAPPHGGLAFGLDRLTMLVTGTDNIKDVIAFPKVQNASCLMSGAPSPVEDKQLKELAIKFDEKKD
ncbi:MAG: aspartate--tRNA ligase [Clostridia bacterium]|jgi:aspartyl-tRNA synthetase|nr:aspartate--tRNA ligase [Clostridia bacterium]